MTKIFIDDERFPPENWGDDYVLLRSFEDFVSYAVNNGLSDVDIISLDHDLGRELTGYDIVKWIVERDLNMEFKFIPSGMKFVIHSMNPIGAENIYQYLTNYISYRNKIKENT